jgi:hypothetical protein
MRDRSGDGQKRLMAESMGLPSDTYISYTVPTTPPGMEYGTDPMGDGTVRMVPSGDVVTIEEADRRLAPMRALHAEARRVQMGA